MNPPHLYHEALNSHMRHCNCYVHAIGFNQNTNKMYRWGIETGKFINFNLRKRYIGTSKELSCGKWELSVCLLLRRNEKVLCSTSEIIDDNALTASTAVFCEGHVNITGMQQNRWNDEKSSNSSTETLHEILIINKRTTSAPFSLDQQLSFSWCTKREWRRRDNYS